MTESTQTPDRLRQLIPILGFNIAYLLAAIVGSIASGNSEFILYIVIMLILGSVVWFADHRVGFSPLVCRRRLENVAPGGRKTGRCCCGGDRCGGLWSVR